MSFRVFYSFLVFLVDEQCGHLRNAVFFGMMESALLRVRQPFAIYVERTVSDWWSFELNRKSWCWTLCFVHRYIRWSFISHRICYGFLWEASLAAVLHAPKCHSPSAHCSVAVPLIACCGKERFSVKGFLPLCPTKSILLTSTNSLTAALMLPGKLWVRNRFWKFWTHISKRGSKKRAPSWLRGLRLLSKET